MSNYPIWWDTTITVYNKYTDPITDVVKWYRHVVTGCFWKGTGGKVKINDVTLDTNSIMCRIPKQDNFMPYAEWVTLPNSDMGEFLTLNVGDIIVKGNIDEDIDEYAKNHRSSDFKAKYKKLYGCMEVEEVSDSTGIGRNQPHYYARGV